MKELEKYVRIGVDYYQLTEFPCGDEMVQKLIRWNKPTIVDDFGRKSLVDIPKYKGFVVNPSHIDYKRELNGFYNLYSPLSYKPKQGKWENIRKLLLHIFGDQYDLGLDYLTLLWQKPKQVLPILCLVSSERNTGKTTFLNLLKSIFEYNMTLNTNTDFRSQFNSDWAEMLIIAIDEVLLDRREDSERIKNLSTAKYFKKESKGKDKVEVEFFGKFILCSNNETDFVKVDDLEMRYWVRKINPLSEINPDFLQALKDEVSAFTYDLSSRTVTSAKTTRMWFSKEQIYTEALANLIRGNKPSIEKEIEELLINEFVFFEYDQLCYTPLDLVEMLSRRNIRTTPNYIGNILRMKYKMNVEKNSSYTLFRSDFTDISLLCTGIAKRGRYFVFDRKLFDIVAN